MRLYEKFEVARLFVKNAQLLCKLTRL